MLIHVRTTIVLDDRVAREAERLAASRGITLSQLVGEALGAALSELPRPATKFEMVTYGDASAPVHHEPADFAGSLE